MCLQSHSAPQHMSRMVLNTLGAKQEVSWGIFTQNSWMRRVWETLDLLLCIQYAVVIPFTACFAPAIQDDAYPLGWLVPSWLVDVFFVIDMWMRFRHFAYMDPDSNEEITEWKRIARHCMKMFFAPIFHVV